MDTFLPCSGGTVSNHLLGSDLDADNKKITDLGDPAADSDAANKKYIDASHLSASGQTNVFKYLMDDKD